MSKKITKNLIVGLDIGTSKVVTLVAEVSSEGHIEVIGAGSHPSVGLKRGIVVNLESTVQSIQKAIEEAETTAGCEIHSVCTGISGSHIRSLNSHGMIPIRDHEVLPTDIDRVLDSAKAVAIPADQKILHILPQEYSIDNQNGIRQPVGMSGVRLEAKVHIVTAAISAAQNIIKCVERCGLQVENMVLQQLASSEAVLGEDEKDLGVCMIDIGGGTTDIAVFSTGSIRYTSVIPIAGAQANNDIAVALRIPLKHAEPIKIKYGSALPVFDSNEHETITVPTVASRSTQTISRSLLSQVIHARYEELFLLIQAELKRNKLENLISSGIVLTDGASQMENIIELAETVFQMPVRIGTPQHIKCQPEIHENPAYATAAGLLLYSHRQQYGAGSHSESTIRQGVRGTWQRVKNWFQGNF